MQENTNIQKMKTNSFSLIMATYGRYIEIDNFLSSIKKANYDRNLVEIIIVDQNIEIDLSDIIDKYSEILNIIHVKSQKRGLSVNRNIGLKYAKGDIIAFPDDDCEYLEDTLNNVNFAFDQLNEYDLIIGKIIDRDKKDSIRIWPSMVIGLSKLNFFTKYSSITMFFKKELFEKIKFNERLGVGTSFGSYEDADIVYKALQNGKVVFTPNILVYHPNNLGMSMNETKTYNYGLGFGGFCKENFDVWTLILFIQVIFYHFMKMGMALFKLDFLETKKRKIAIFSRLEGFISYKKGWKG